MRSKLIPELIGAYGRMTNAPDTHLADWLGSGAPLGLNQPIPTAGVFPAVEVPDPEDDFENVASQIDAESFRNYKSFDDDPAATKKEIDRMHAGGYLHFFDSVEELTEYVGGPPLLNKIAFLVKTRRDGKVKVRVITDLLR